MDSLAALPDDYFVSTGQFTKTVYRDLYPGVDPTSPALSQKGKVVVITGASHGLGRYAYAKSFATADSRALVLVARRQAELDSAAADLRNLRPNVQVLTVALDVRSEEAVNALWKRIEAEFGTVDVLINNAGSGKSVLSIKDLDPNDFWEDFEINVKGTFLMTQGFLKLLDNKHGTLINVTSAAGIAIIPHTASYSLSKLVQIQIQRFVAAENPNVTAISLHPGTVLTPITKPAFVKFSLDTYGLAGGVAVWLATDEAKFMNGRYMGSNWSVNEMMDRQEEIVSKELLNVELQGTFGKAQFEK